MTPTPADRPAARELAGRMLPRMSARVSPGTWAAVLILASAASAILFLWVRCPFGLSPDEAHYWDWSLRLDWSYYSKGPLVAFLIRASCELLGPLSVALTGDPAAAVRFPAIMCHAALLAGWYVLAAGVFRSPALGLAVVAAAAALPVVRIASILMTIDPPFLACWAWALVCVWRGLETGRPGWWAGAGVCTALGILAKYTMALFPAAVLAYLVFHRRGEFRRPGVWLLLAGGVLGWVPVVVWNAQHDWVTFRHVFGQVGVGGAGAARISPLAGAGNFLVGQIGVMFALWLVAFLAAAWRFRPTRETDEGVRLLWWVSVPVWGLFAAASTVKSGQPNWPAPAYVGGLVLAVAWVREALSGPLRRWVIAGTAFSVVVGLAFVAALQSPRVVRPFLASVSGPPTDARPYPARRFDLTARLAGWRQLAGEVDALCEQVRAETGLEPVVVGTNWTMPGVLRFYRLGNPEAYAIGTVNGTDRYSQYDLERPNPAADAQAFRGRPFVIVGWATDATLAGFDRVGPPVRVVHAEGGVPLVGWDVRVGYGFRGFPARADSAHGY